MTASRGTFDRIEPYLEDLEARLDADVEMALLAEWERFADGGFAGDLFSPRRPAPARASIDWSAVSVNAALDSFDAMALQQFKPCSDALAAGSGALHAVRCGATTARASCPTCSGPSRS